MLAAAPYAAGVSFTGRSVVITRAKVQSATLAAALAAQGARVIEVAVLAIAPPVDGGAGLRTAVASRRAYDWIVLTSPNGVEAFVAALDGSACEVPVAVVGSGTAARLASHGITAALVPERFVSEGLVEAFPNAPGSGGRVLIAQAEAARDVVEVGLRAKGWQVTTVTAYRSVSAPVDAAALDAASAADAIVFTSASTVEHYVAAAGVDAVPNVVACIGPVTEAAARSFGISVTVVASPHTIEGVVEALAAYFAALDDPRV